MKNKQYLVYVFFLVSSLGFLSCISWTEEVAQWVNVETVDEVSGKYHFLEDNGINIYLPGDFKRYSLLEYQQLLDSLATKEEYTFQVNRLNSISDMEGKLYLFYDTYSTATLLVNSMPYTPISKEEAQMFLGMLRMNHEAMTRDAKLDITRLTAKYVGGPTQHVFNCIHQIDNKQQDLTWYTSTYIVTSNQKTAFIQLTTPFEVNFNPFIDKMTM